VPVVCVDRPLPRFPVDSVVLDDVVGATQAMGLLFAAGYNRVACATGPEHVPTASNRAAGWRLAYLERTGGEPPEGYLDFSSYSVAGGEAAARRLLALPEPPDAFFAANNRIAMGVLTVLAERGLMPPATGLLSFGDLGLPQVLLPPRGVISTTLPERELGLAAARQLLERVAGADGPARHLVVPMTVEPPDR
jgi:LacI family transcriptional regulator